MRGAWLTILLSPPESRLLRPSIRGSESVTAGEASMTRDSVSLRFILGRAGIADAFWRDAGMIAESTGEGFMRSVADAERQAEDIGHA